jgi:uncharacterized circularly permuted ATP-grasp superfamily protein
MPPPNVATYDEMLDAGGLVQPAYAGFRNWYDMQDRSWLRRQEQMAERFFRRLGITFNVYSDDDGEEQLIPFDLIPRIITAAEWRKLTRGIEQRVQALNAFLHDIYHRQEIIRAGRLPEFMVNRNPAFLPQMVGFEPPGGIYTHIVGVDLVRTGPEGGGRRCLFRRHLFRLGRGAEEGVSFAGRL